MNELTEDDKHALLRLEYAQKSMGSAINMARVRFTMFHNTSTAFDFKVYTQIWQDDDWEYNDHLEYIKNLVVTGVELNTSSYKAMSDQLFLLMATDMPGREIWIVINSEHTGLTTKYK